MPKGSFGNKLPRPLMMKTGVADEHSPWVQRVCPAAFAATLDGPSGLGYRTTFMQSCGNLYCFEFFGGYQMSNGLFQA
jgi:hypothetical protein